MNGWRAGWMISMALLQAGCTIAVAGGSLGPSPPMQIRIVNEAGEPVPKAQVWLLAPDPSTESPCLAATLESDEDGYVLGPELQHGQMVLARKDALLGWLQHVGGRSTVVLTPATSQISGSVLLLPGPRTMPVQVRVRSITRLSGPGGCVILPAELDVLSARRGIRGSFTIDGVPSDASVNLTVEGDGAETIWSDCRPGQSVTLVEFAGCRADGIVRDSAGRPLADVLVEACLQMPFWKIGAIIFPRSWARTDSAGRFSFPRLHNRMYLFSLVEPGWYAHVAVATPQSTGDVPLVELRAGQGGRVEGRVGFEVDNEPAIRGHILFLPLDHPQPFGSGMTAWPDLGGSFAITLPEGAYRVQYVDLDARRYFKPETEVGVREGEVTAVEIIIGPDTPSTVVYPRF